MGQFFICHSSADGREAMALAVALEARDQTCWIAPRNIGAGANYPHEIVEGLKRCPEFIIVLSASAVRSDHVLRELEMAVSQRKKIIPLRLSGVELGNSVSYLLASVQWIEASDEEWKKEPDHIADRILGGAGSRLDYEPAEQRRSRIWTGVAYAGLLALAAAAGVWKIGWLGPRPVPAASAAGPALGQDAVKILPVEPDSTGGAGEQGAVPYRPPTTVGEEQKVPAGVSPEGNWQCVVKGTYQIEWLVTLTKDGGELRGSGEKMKVDGRPVTRGEWHTTIELRGNLNGTVWEGRYVEASKRISEGEFQIRFSEDLRSFKGRIFAQGLEAAVVFEGAKR